MFLLIAAGIGIAASVVSWVNGKRTDEVEARISELESQWAAILSSDANERKQLAIDYIIKFRQLLEIELISRNEIATSLIASLDQARKIVLRKFGSAESDGFLQALLEMELANERLNGERAQFNRLLQALPLTADEIDLENALPSPNDLILPRDFPVPGVVLDLSGDIPSLLYGYELNYVQENDASQRQANGMVISVDHVRQSAKVSRQSGALMAANLVDGGNAIDAIIESIGPGHIECSYMGVRLLLNTDDTEHVRSSKVDDTLTVYPEIWTLSEVMAKGAKSPLPVRLRPRIGATREIWSPIFLAISEDMMQQLVKAYDTLESQGRSHEKWHIFANENGQISFSQGDVTLITDIDLLLKSFVLSSINFASNDSVVSVSLYVELHAFIPETEDDKPEERVLFSEFLCAVRSELSHVNSMHFQRQNAVRLRKLSLIYQDHFEHLQAKSSCGFIVGAVAPDGIIEGTLTITKIPTWIIHELNSKAPPKLRAVGAGHEWHVIEAEWIDFEMGLLKLKLNEKKKYQLKSPTLFQITRIEMAGEGSQQKTFYRALENAIAGRFTSPAVHHALMARGMTNISVENLGRNAVDSLLHSTQPLIAIWGPPGTGKTTMLVDWMLSLFNPNVSSSWPTILITGPTNVAVTKLVSDLIKRAEYLEQELVRYGREEHIKGTPIAKMWHKALLAPFEKQDQFNAENDLLLQRWGTLLGTAEGRESVSKWVLGPRHIHAATCVGMESRDYGLSKRAFDIVIIDEAGKAFDAELFIPAARARRLILVGDHYQLPPTVTDEFLNPEIPYQLPLSEVEELLCNNCFKDLFERLPANSKGMLTIQYRMHSDIGELVSQLFYKGKLESHRSEPGWLLSTHRITFVDFSELASYRHNITKKQNSPRNEIECRSLMNMLNRLNSLGNAQDKKILVICPYKGQREDVDIAVSKLNLNLTINITTVDAVQGGEADIVFLLMTRSSGRVEFLLDHNRLNVALSRARDAIYILGHRQCLSPNGKGPFADLIKLGLDQQTLRVIRANDKTTNIALARSVFI